MDKLQGKYVKVSAIEDHTYRIFPNDLNSQGTVFGGLIMSILDRVALVVAERHSGKTCVTASVDAMHFLAPAGRGDNLIFKAAINRTWNTSMEVGVKVLAEDTKTMTQKHILSAYFTFVALNENQKPSSVFPIIPKTKAEIRRYQEAELRRQGRFHMAEETKKSRKSHET